MKGLFLLLPFMLSVEGCGNCGDSKGPIPMPCPGATRQANEPFFRERDSSGVYPHSVAELNGSPFFIVGLTHHFTRAK